MMESTIIPTLPAEEYERRQRRENSHLASQWDLLDAVKDPEIPAVSLWEMGILQDVQMHDDRLVVIITPTYSGCPAMKVMEEDLLQALESAGFPDSEVITRLSPAWTSRWISEEAQEKLRAYGIAPPGSDGGADSILCPQCGSVEVRKLSEFGSTACKALYQCSNCSEPFDYFKPI